MEETNHLVRRCLLFDVGIYLLASGPKTHSLTSEVPTVVLDLFPRPGYKRRSSCLRYEGIPRPRRSSGIQKTVVVAVVTMRVSHIIDVYKPNVIWLAVREWFYNDFPVPPGSGSEMAGPR